MQVLKWQSSPAAHDVMASCASAVAILVASRDIPLPCGTVVLCMYVGNLSMGSTAHLGRYDVRPAL